MPPLSPPHPQYAYLLGLYLGDGHIARMARTYHLRIFCDARYPQLVSAARDAIGAVCGRRAGAGIKTSDECVVISSYWKAWPTFLPQHGSGRKHLRDIALTDWQRAITRTHPEAFIRGLLHSDGCRFVARQPARGKIYSYVRYCFCNASEDILRICCEHLDLLGIRWTRTDERNIQIARRASVEKLERFVGPKL